MSGLKPGEFVGTDGKIHSVRSVGLKRGVDDSIATINGIVCGLYIDPDHPDFPAAVEALRALIPEPFEWEITEHDWPRRWNGVCVERFDEVRDMWIDTGSEETVAFEQGRRYERERGHADE